MTVRRVPPHTTSLAQTSDLTDLWRSVLGDEPIGHRALWLLFADDTRRPVGTLIAIEDLPDGPYDLAADDLVGLCREIIDGPGSASSVAFLIVRPGALPWTVSDRAWGRFLLRVNEQLPGHTWPVHWAHQSSLEEFGVPG